MASFIRTLQRKRLRQGTFTTDDEGNTVRVDHEPKPQPTFGLPDGGYVTVRYTRGPLAVSAARLRAQARLAEIQHPADMLEQARMFSRAIASAQKATEEAKRLDELLAAPVHRVTRQMRRLAKRTGRPVPTMMSRPETQIAEALVETAKAKRARKPKTARVDGVAMTSEKAATAPRKPRAKKAAAAQQAA